MTGLSSTSGTPLWFPDPVQNPFNIGIGVVVNSTAAAPSWSVQASFDYTGSSAFISSNATWFELSGLASASSNATGNIAFPTTALRLNSIAGSSTQIVTATIIQAGV